MDLFVDQRLCRRLVCGSTSLPSIHLWINVFAVDRTTRAHTVSVAQGSDRTALGSCNEVYNEVCWTGPFTLLKGEPAEVRVVVVVDRSIVETFVAGGWAVGFPPTQSRGVDYKQAIRLFSANDSAAATLPDVKV